MTDNSTRDRVASQPKRAVTEPAVIRVNRDYLQLSIADRARHIAFALDHVDLCDHAAAAVADQIVDWLAEYERRNRA
jgi:hypothetical protein